MDKPTFFHFAGSIGLTLDATRFVWDLLRNDTHIVLTAQAERMKTNVDFRAKIQMMFPGCFV